MKKIKLIIFTAFVFLMAVNVNAATKLELSGVNKLNYGATVSYDVILNTDEEVYGFQFDLDIDSNLTYLAHQSNIVDLIVKVSDNKTRVIGYGKELHDGDNLMTIVFNVGDLEKTTNVNVKLKNKILTNTNNVTLNDSEVTSYTTKVVVPVKEEKTTTTITKTSAKPKEDKKVVEEPEKEEDNKKEEESKTSKIIKIVIIVLLGALILYLLNKEDSSEESIKKQKKDKKIDK